MRFGEGSRSDHARCGVEPLDRVPPARMSPAESSVITVERVHAIENYTRAAGAGERGSDLPADDARFANADDDELGALPERVHGQCHGSFKGGIEAGARRLQGGDLDVEYLRGPSQMRHVAESLPSGAGAFNQKVWCGLRFVTLTERRIRSNVLPCARVVELRCSVLFRIRWLALSAGIGEAPRPDRLRWVQSSKFRRPRRS